MDGAKTVTAPAAAPILSTFLRLIVDFDRSSSLVTSGRFAFLLGIESPFSPVGLNLKTQAEVFDPFRSIARRRAVDC